MISSNRYNPGNGHHRLVDFLKTTRLKYKICYRLYISAPLLPMRAPSPIDNRSRHPQHHVNSIIKVSHTLTKLITITCGFSFPTRVLTPVTTGRYHARLAVENVSPPICKSSGFRNIFLLFFLYPPVKDCFG